MTNNDKPSQPLLVKKMGGKPKICGIQIAFFLLLLNNVFVFPHEFERTVCTEYVLLLQEVVTDAGV